MNKNLYFVCCRSSSPVFCGTREKKRPTLSPPCVHADFPASDANSPPSPLAEFCVPCVPSGTGGTLLSQPSHKTTQAPCSPPEGPFCPVSAPGGGTTRIRPVRGRFGPHRAQFSRKKRKRPHNFCRRACFNVKSSAL